MEEGERLQLFQMKSPGTDVLPASWRHLAPSRPLARGLTAGIGWLTVLFPGAW